MISAGIKQTVVTDSHEEVFIIKDRHGSFANIKEFETIESFNNYTDELDLGLNRNPSPYKFCDCCVERKKNYIYIFNPHSFNFLKEKDRI